MRTLLLLALTLLLSINAALAQDKAQPTGTPYKISPGDILDVNVQDHADLSKTITVLPDGTISYPYAGEISVTGLSLKDLSAKLVEALGKQIASPIVIVTIQKLHEQVADQVIALGAIKVPGKHVLKEGWRVLDLIVDCGGLTGEPESVSASLIHNGTETVKLDISKIMAGTDPKMNRELKPDDVVVFTTLDQAKLEAQVLGEVNRPGYVPVTRDGSIAGILNAAGGVTPRASLSKATLMHDGKSRIVDLHTLLTEGKVPADVAVMPGDTLFIPQNREAFSVFGSVARPGVQVYPEDKPVTVLSALSIAGGQNADANLKTVSLVHPSATGKATVETINLEMLLKKGDMSRDLPMKPGDILYVSAKSQKRTGAGLLDILTFLPLVNLFRTGL